MPYTYCQNNHELKSINYVPYDYTNYYYCNVCNACYEMGFECILNCEICRYDICPRCQKHFDMRQNFTVNRWNILKYLGKKQHDLHHTYLINIYTYEKQIKYLNSLLNESSEKKKNFIYDQIKYLDFVMSINKKNFEMISNKTMHMFDILDNPNNITLSDSEIDNIIKYNLYELTLELEDYPKRNLQKELIEFVDD
jgi:hypothetical protein